MPNLSEDIEAGARALIGCRFRPQGRDPGTGLDCVGVAVLAFAGAGVRIDAPCDYPQRGRDPQRVAVLAKRAGLERIAPATATTGDIILLDAGPAQLHLAVLTSTGFVHADAGLRRVVETPGRPGWPLIAAWRPEREEG